MAVKKFFIDPLNYKNKLKEAILEAGGEIIPSDSAQYRQEIFYLDRLAMVYNGKKNFYVAGTKTQIKKTLSKLEKLSGYKLAEI